MSFRGLRAGWGPRVTCVEFENVRQRPAVSCVGTGSHKIGGENVFIFKGKFCGFLANRELSIFIPSSALFLSVFFFFSFSSYPLSKHVFLIITVLYFFKLSLLKTFFEDAWF